MGELKPSEIHWVANDYIGVDGGYLGDFSYRTHREFYPAYCDVQIDPEGLSGTTRERFLKILGDADARSQAAILRGVVKRFPVGSAVYRTSAAAERIESFALRCSRTAAVDSVDLKISSDVVKRALADAAQLLSVSGATSALDRVHTALHGYLKAACATQQIAVPADAPMTTVYKLLREHHPRLRDLGPHQDSVNQVLRTLASVVDALNPARNRGSLAHANEALLGESEAMLFINAGRTVLQYLDGKFL